MLTLNSKEPSLVARAPNWTTQAWQVKCNNIDYFGDNNDCCKFVSGPDWKSCNNVGYAEVSRSEVLCYSLNEGHDCCDDNSVCDEDMGCCEGTCCQSDSSITVCEDGCVSLDGMGCADGTCAHGENKDDSTTAEPDTDETEPTGTSDDSSSSQETSAGSSSKPSSSGDSSGDSSSKKDGGGLSRSDKIALGCGIGIGLPSTLAALWMCFRGR
ncbi:hypothetical protein ACJ41O_006072 [Fusarium nematophilum]